MAYWRPKRGKFVPGVPMTNYSDAAMRELEERHPGIREGGAFERVDDKMPEDEPRTAPAEVAEAVEATEGEEPSDG